MTTVALVHPDHGTHFAYDKGELERLKKAGWTVRPDDWKAQKQAADKARRLEAAKAEQERLAAEVAALEAAEDQPEPAVEEVAAPKNKGGRPRKVA